MLHLRTWVGMRVMPAFREAVSIPFPLNSSTVTAFQISKVLTSSSFFICCAAARCTFGTRNPKKRVRTGKLLQKAEYVHEKLCPGKETGSNTIFFFFATSLLYGENAKGGILGDRIPFKVGPSSPGAKLDSTQLARSLSAHLIWCKPLL